MALNFKIITPCFNAEKWVDKCIQSIYLQTYEKWECVILNDASTDSTLDVIEKTIPEEFKSKFKVVSNDKNIGALNNIINGVKLISHDPEDVIVLLDGDDWFATKYALEYVNRVYEDKNIWLTYGQFTYLKKNMMGCNAKINSIENYRNGERWKTSHLRTFKNRIWNLIKDEDFRDKNGKYYSMAWDLAIMLPLIEMAGADRIKFIRAVLYKYNDLNPLNDDKKSLETQRAMDREIRQKPKYEVLP